jgi:hypothetical protein
MEFAQDIFYSFLVPTKELQLGVARCPKSPKSGCRGTSLELEGEAALPTASSSYGKAMMMQDVVKT